MPGFDLYSDDFNFCSIDDEPISSAYTTLFLLAGILIATVSIAKFAESNNRFNYESRLARIIAGFLILTMNMFHTKKGDLELTDTEKSLVAIGPHRTGWEGMVVASKMKGRPPRFFATDAYNVVPGVSTFMTMFKTIPIKAHASKGNNGQSANAEALVIANRELKDNGCIALFPQGNFAKIGQKPHRVYVGIAKMALEAKSPILVIRLDGFWCLINPLIPLFIRNNSYYRAFLSLFHMNNIRTTLCCKIDFHLNPENAHLSEEDITREICAQLYAFYRHTKELTSEQIETIKTEISAKTHLLIWDNKVRQDQLTKDLTTLEKEAEQWEELPSIRP
ncbi:1-acyl-sn-glycerol-3-phosphate acyltransferase [Legionella sp. km772]|uniref:lysophospholipid acyltransferase family protein n=1 Tax=Legionella sp. km772 TaxID=2498111 RepID=UPI000F8F4A4B|nr:1-acyl-sn-glycerol-3-phosphate acyltransferase [Legionella sp. km772]RUR13184.1 1-acyl-sn-glycerol-3-phosphate acyltransferase [Legionella sp. km772]